VIRYLAALLLAFCSVPAVAQTPVERHGQLQVQGNRIVEQREEPVVLRGMSLFWSQWQPEYYNASALRWLRDDWNISVIRAGAITSAR
jgi:endoglucanase